MSAEEVLHALRRLRVAVEVLGGPSEPVGQLGRPVPAAINDSGPLARRDAQNATVRPVPTAPSYQEAAPSMGRTTPGSSVPSNGKPTGAIRGSSTTEGGRP